MGGPPLQRWGDTNGLPIRVPHGQQPVEKSDLCVWHRLERCLLLCSVRPLEHPCHPTATTAGGRHTTRNSALIAGDKTDY